MVAATKGAAPQQPVESRTRQDIWTIDADGGNRQRLTDGNGTNLSPCWAADNRIYFISDRGGPECVWSVRTDGPKGNAVAGAVSARQRHHRVQPDRRKRSRPSRRTWRSTREKPIGESCSLSRYSGRG